MSFGIPRYNSRRKATVRAIAHKPRPVAYSNTIYNWIMLTWP